MSKNFLGKKGTTNVHVYIDNNRYIDSNKNSWHKNVNNYKIFPEIIKENTYIYIVKNCQASKWLNFKISFVQQIYIEFSTK